jgi:hypothetical protein
MRSGKRYFRKFGDAVKTLARPFTRSDSEKADHKHTQRYTIVEHGKEETQNKGNTD